MHGAYCVNMLEVDMLEVDMLVVNTLEVDMLEVNTLEVMRRCFEGTVAGPGISRLEGLK